MNDILITGDVYLGDDSVIDLAEKGEAELLFGDFYSIINKSTFSVTNLESPITDSIERITKTGPYLKSSIKSLEVLKKAGFDLLTLANNHIMDFGKQGLESTLDECRKLNLNHVGAGKSISDARKAFVTEINKKSVSILNISENEFSTIGKNKYGANSLDLINNSYDIKKAKEESDLVIVIVHGGREHYQLPSPNFRKTLRFFANSGADAVLAHHTHCFSGYEIFNNTPIFYGLGNFLFNKPKDSRKPFWNMGMGVRLIVNDTSCFDFELIPYDQCDNKECTIEIMKGEKKEEFLKNIEELNTIIADDELIQNRWEEYLETQTEAYKKLFFIKNQLLRKLANRNLIPETLFINKKHKAFSINLIRCETHREILLESLLK